MFSSRCIVSFRFVDQVEILVPWRAAPQSGSLVAIMAGPSRVHRMASSRRSHAEHLIMQNNLRSKQINLCPLVPCI